MPLAAPPPLLLGVILLQTTRTTPQGGGGRKRDKDGEERMGIATCSPHQYQLVKEYSGPTGTLPIGGWSAWLPLVFESLLCRDWGFHLLVAGISL